MQLTDFLRPRVRCPNPWRAALLAPFALLLIAASTATAEHFDLQQHWQAPAATSGEPPHDWSRLERDLSPESCAQCHTEQFEAWRDSLHAHALSPGLLGQFPQLGLKESNDCLNCHAPLAEQKLNVPAQIDATLLEHLQRPEGFDRTANASTPRSALRHAGVTCAACHVRGWQRFGPPRRGMASAGHMAGAAHGGFTATPAFEQSNFCAGCHQFPQAYAINGKPLENTFEEWRRSSFARRGIQCQSCHMPDRKHAFKGIHDPAMVRSGLDIRTHASQQRATLSIASTAIGHAFPTYVTPDVEVSIEALDTSNRIVLSKRWQIGRRVAFTDSWQELSDTRLQAGETREFTLTDIPGSATHLHFSVEVRPDAFYKDIYKELLAGDTDGHARQLIAIALTRAESNDYHLFEEHKELPHETR